MESLTIETIAHDIAILLFRYYKSHKSILINITNQDNINKSLNVITNDIINLYRYKYKDAQVSSVTLYDKYCLMLYNDENNIYYDEYIHYSFDTANRILLMNETSNLTNHEIISINVCPFEGISIMRDDIYFIFDNWFI